MGLIGFNHQQERLLTMPSNIAFVRDAAKNAAPLNFTLAFANPTHCKLSLPAK